jgi:SAM-dependent methyltransferase
VLFVFCVVTWSTSPVLQNPEYLDLAFRDETRREADFFEAAFRKYCRRPVRRLLEPGCGGGRLVLEMAQRGYDVSGFDINPQALDYLRRRLRRRRLDAHVFFGDMADFRVSRPVDGAFNTWNTFRHLLSEREARGHLQSMAAAVRRGGLYILGLHLLPLDVDEHCIERWSVRQGRTTVTATLRVLATDRRRRLEQLRLSLRVRSPARDRKLRYDFAFRMYTAGQFRRLLSSVPKWQLCDVYDFWFDIHEPLVLDDEITDTLFVLRRV